MISSNLPDVRIRACFARVVLCCLAGAAMPAATADAEKRVAKNPYEAVDWKRARQYKADLHVHTIKSDGRAEPRDMIHAYAKAGYDILAITDHDNFYRHRPGERRVARTTETTWPWTRWIDEMPAKVWTHDGMESSAFYPDLGEHGMLAVRGNELTGHPHIVSLFNDCGFESRNVPDRDRLGCIDKKRGLAYWAHPMHYLPGGEWAGERWRDVTWDEAVAYFGSCITRHESLLGLEFQLHEEREGDVERDVKLFDRLLMAYYADHDLFISGHSDNHAGGESPVSAKETLTIVLAPELTEEAVRHALRNGHTFVGKRGESYPQFRNVVVDEQANTITLKLDNYDEIEWIKNGETHATGVTLDYSEMKGAVLRFEVTLDERTFYSQAFYID